MHAYRPHGRSRPLAVTIVAAALALAGCSTAGSGADSGIETSAAAVTTAPTRQPTHSPTPEATPEPADDGEAPPPDAVRFDGDATVDINAWVFSASDIVIRPGAVVTFVNNDGVDHTVTEGENGIASAGSRFNKLLPGGGEVEVSFDDPGRHPVTCLPHSQMNMTVWVED